MANKSFNAKKEFFKYTGSLFLYQAISSLMTLFMCLGVIAFFGAGWWQLILTSAVPSITIYSMAYLEAWKYGFRQKGATGDGKALINAGPVRLDCFIAALIFELPSVVLYLFFVLGNSWATLPFLFTRYNFYGIYYTFAETEGWRYIIPFLFLVSPILAILGHNFGSRDFSVIDFIKYGKNKK